jgi:replicative DNA helicase
MKIAVAEKPEFQTQCISPLDLAEELTAYHKHGLPRGDSSGWPVLDEHYTVLRGQWTLISGIPGHGKALALDTPVPTPAGWTTMGELRAGDQVFDESGAVCNIVHAFDVLHGRPCYRVTFTGGETIVSDAEHQWVTRSEAARASANNTRQKRGERKTILPKGTDQTWKRTYPSVVTTEQIASTMHVRGRLNHAVAMCGAIEPQQNIALPIPPYTLGVWLGDGSSYYGGLTCADDQIISELTADGTAPVKWPSGKYSYGLPRLIGRLRLVGVLENKHIPTPYLRASAAQRLALLQGLMDTDGYASKVGDCEFTSVNRRLVDDFVELVRSLGMRANVRVGRATIAGRYIGPKYRVIFAALMPVFRLSRKLARLNLNSKTYRHRKIIAVERVASVPVRCIAVDSKSHQYLVSKSFIPTHNSEFLDALMMNLAINDGWVFAIFSPENQPHQIHVAKLLEKLLRKPFGHGPNERIGSDEMAGAIAWMDSHFRFIKPHPELQVPNIRTIIEASSRFINEHDKRAGEVQKYGIVIDPWNELEHRRPSNQSETEYISETLAYVRQFAREWNVHIFMVAHPRIMHRDKDGKRPVPTPYDVSGSSHWYNKSDNCITVWRDTNPDANSQEVKIYVQKVRFKNVGRPGEVTLSYDRVTGRYYTPLQNRNHEVRRYRQPGDDDE